MSTNTAGLTGEHQFRQLADNAPVMIWRADLTKGCDLFNKPWLDFTGRTLEQELGNGWAEGVHPDDMERCLAIYIGSFDARREFSMVYRLRRHDGVYRFLLDNGRPFYADNGNFAGYFGSCIDVTEMEDTRRALEQAVSDKEVLIREMQHRVRNNMQLISGLLTLQADAVEGAEAKQKLTEAAGRVQSIALVQERLHESDNPSGLDFGDYARSLMNSISGLVSRPELRFEVEVDSVRLPIDRAAPLGLILNELVTNSIKHAFSPGQAGCIRVRVEGNAGTGMTVSVADDGIGIPERAGSGGRTGLGMRLVRRLARQAGASIEWMPGPGTLVRLLLAPIEREGVPPAGVGVAEG